MFKQRKRIFLSLVQLSQYKFVLCSYQPKDTHPKDTLMLDQGLTVEYASDNGEEGGIPGEVGLIEMGELFFW